MTVKASNPEKASKDMPHSIRKRKGFGLWLERVLLGSGVLLLLVFSGLKFQQADASRAAVLSFYQQAEAATQAESGADIAPEPGISLEANADLDESPNFDLWSEKRVAEYQASLELVTDPPLGVLRIDRLAIEVPVYNGTDDLTLNRGAGRIIGTAQVDGPGNLGIASHRDGFFRGLKDIEEGDILEFQTTRGVTQYRVGSTTIVDPSDVSVLAPTEIQTITLVTCYPFYFVGHAPKRFIVQATAIPQIVLN